MATIYAKTKMKMVPGRDGVPLAVWEMGEGPVTWVIAPGLGTPHISWKFIAERFQHELRIITWDARGTYSSGVPEDRDHLRVEDHTDDLFAVIEHFKLKEYVLGGWSMGVQISLEAYHRDPKGVLALVLLNGAPGRLLSTAYGVPGLEKLAINTLEFGSRMGDRLAPALTWMITQPWSTSLMLKLKMFTSNERYFKDMLATFSELDWSVYFHMMALTNEHTGVPYLPEVAVPTLVTAGTADKMTPLATAELIADTVPDAELFVVPNGTHYTIIEYPEIINLRLERFFRDHVPEANIE
jgi:pimeloyl-ACP methyl ester carboxylesterase